MGPEGLRQLIGDRLLLRLPPVLRQLEAELGLVAGKLSPPSLLAPLESRLLAVEDFPAVLVSLLDAPQFEALDWGPPIELRLQTTVRVLAYARSAGADTPEADPVEDPAEEAGTGRDRLMLALRRSIIAERDWGRPGVLMLVQTYKESYSEVGDDRVGRSIAAGYAEFRVATHEAVPTL